MKRSSRKIVARIISIFILLGITIGSITVPMDVFAAPKSGAASSQSELEANEEERKKLPIESNLAKGWPAGPEIGAEAAILMDVDTGTILYSKNIHEELYPASTTKLMTCLIAGEQGKMTDMVGFSHDAVFSVPADGSKIGMDVGQSITLEQSLYGILVGSANEVANAVGEYVSGSVDEFVNLMNERAKELGCQNTHFSNTNGLHSEDHYTSAYDLALIGKAYFANETLSRIANTARYHFEPTDTQPDDFWLKNKHSLINGDISYEGIKGGKTGYTDDARQTLVTCCERNGMRLICVVMMEESPNQFYDTVTLLDYGYSNFSRIRVSEYEKRYTINAESFFKTGSDIFGNSKPFLTLNKDSIIIMPQNVSFEDLDTRISYNVEDAIAQIYYSYSGVELGSALVETLDNEQPEYEFEHVTTENEEPENKISIDEQGETKTIFINVKFVMIVMFIVVAVAVIFVIVLKITSDYHFAGRKERRTKRHKIYRAKKNRKYRGRFSDYDF